MSGLERGRSNELLRDGSSAVPHSPIAVYQRPTSQMCACAAGTSSSRERAHRVENSAPPRHCRFLQLSVLPRPQSAVDLLADVLDLHYSAVLVFYASFRRRCRFSLIVSAPKPPQWRLLNPGSHASREMRDWEEASSPPSVMRDAIMILCSESGKLLVLFGGGSQDADGKNQSYFSHRLL